jgi:hypothetical protein
VKVLDLEHDVTDLARHLFLPVQLQEKALAIPPAPYRRKRFKPASGEAAGGESQAFPSGAAIRPVARLQA